MRVDVVTELARIADQNDGQLLAEAVVRAAEPLDSPLHARFQWDDTIAGYQYRLAQARHLIAVTVEYIAHVPSETRVYVSLSSDRTREGGGYRVTATVMQNPNQRAQLLHDAYVDMRRFQAKYHLLTELSKVFDAMNGLAA